MTDNFKAVWVFHADSAQFSSGVFTTKQTAEQWIARHQLSGMLTKYPLDTGVYDWAIAEGIFKPRQEYQTGTKFIGRFTSASQEHYHYELGINVEEEMTDDSTAGRPETDSI